MAIEIRFINNEELGDFRHTQFVGMGLNPYNDDLDRVRKTFEVDRAIAAFDGSKLVGTLGCATLALHLSDEHQCWMAGTTTVAVLPTHRRQGIMTKMMLKHFDDARNRENPVAGLWASQSAVYGRFGYGVAAYQNELSIHAAKVKFTGPNSSLDVSFIGAEEAKTILPKIYETAIKAIPGTNGRSENWWNYRRLRDSESNPYLYLVTKRGSEITGYAQFCRTSSWKNGLPHDQISVVELMALDKESESSLWKTLLETDLVATVNASNRPVDDCIQHWVDEPRLVESRLEDSLWLRPLDIPALLSSKKYSGESSLALKVVDDFSCSGGTFKLEAHPEGGRCKSTSATADITLSCSTLAKLLVGGHRATQLYRCGLVEGDKKSIHTLDSQFTTHRAPWATDKF